MAGVNLIRVSALTGYSQTTSADNCGDCGKTPGRAAGMKGMNTIEADNMTLLDDDAYKAETIAGGTLRHEETSREAQLPPYFGARRS